MNPNDLVTIALRSPLHVFMGDTMLITMTGRKSGRKLSVPVNYYQAGDTFWVLSTRTRIWWRNLLLGAPVTLHVRGKDARAFAEVIRDEKVVAIRLGDYVRRFPAARRYLGVRVQAGLPDPADLARLAKEKLFVKICLES